MRAMKTSKDKVMLNVFGYIILAFFSVMCIFPFVLIISGSFSDNYSVAHYGFSVWPRAFSLQAYRFSFKEPMKILNAYETSIIVTICGTFLTLFIDSMAGYVLARRDYKYRNKFSFFFFFTTIFNGGLVPWYIMCIKYLHFSGHPLIAMILPGAFSYFYIIIIRSFIMSTPDSLAESAKIDGANDFAIYIRIILPLAKPVLATVGLFAALTYWNDWFNAMMFVNKDRFFPLQYFLYTIINSQVALNNISAAANISTGNIPTDTFKLAVTIITTGPIVLLYPFLQKYFIKGMLVGAVKG